MKHEIFNDWKHVRRACRWLHRQWSMKSDGRAPRTLRPYHRAASDSSDRWYHMGSGGNKWIITAKSTISVWYTNSSSIPIGNMDFYVVVLLYRSPCWKIRPHSFMNDVRVVIDTPIPDELTMITVFTQYTCKSFQSVLFLHCPKSMNNEHVSRHIHGTIKGYTRTFGKYSKAMNQPGTVKIRAASVD